MKKKAETALRLRYVRALERFSKGIVAYLSKTQEPSKTGYEKKIANAQKLLDRVEKVPVYKSELQELEKLVEKMRSFVDSDIAIDSIKKEILYSANRLEKSKNFKKYKKPKHSKNALDGWE